MNRYIKTLIFLILLLMSNLYLLRSGFWFYQDAGYWPKTGQEAIVMLEQQFQNFTAYGYVIGFDQGLFNFTRIVVSLTQTLLFFIFGHSGSQIAFPILGYILTFVSFYLFSGIFFKNNNLRYVLSLLYTFSPLTYALQGHTFYQAISPLFIYSFYQYYYAQKKLRVSFLLLNIVSGFLWVSYIRFFQSNFFIIFPYLIYLFIVNNKKIPIKRTIIIIISYILLFLPVIYSVAAQLLERSQTAFNYGTVLGKFVAKYKMFDTFNVFQSVGVRLYEGNVWAIIGILFFSVFLTLIITTPRHNRSPLFFLNFLLIIFAITIYSLGNIFNGDLYTKLLYIFPFVTNEPFWAFYVLGLPSVFLLGILTSTRIKFLYIYSGIFILIATLPLLKLSDFQLQKYDLSKIPTSYYEYFIKPHYGIPESTQYIPSICWRAEYMNNSNTPTLCPNYGLRYVPILIDNPRYVSGDTLALSETLKYTVNVDNLRITHNLKNIIAANDFVESKDFDLFTYKKEYSKIQNSKKYLDLNNLLNVKKNENFNHYYFKDKNSYDFTVYSPGSIVYKNIKDIEDDSLILNNTPVVLKPENVIKLPANIKKVNVFYKISPTNHTRVDIKVSDINPRELFLIQLNKAYGESWKLKIVDEDTFNKSSCLGEPTNFKITNNKRCQYNISFIDINNIKLLNAPEIKSSNHFRGNFLSNGWIVNPNDIPSKFLNKGNVHFVVIYEKQVFYSYTILITGCISLLLLIAAFLQESKILYKNIKTNR